MSDNRGMHQTVIVDDRRAPHFDLEGDVVAVFDEGDDSFSYLIVVDGFGTRKYHESALRFV